MYWWEIFQTNWEQGGQIIYCKVLVKFQLQGIILANSSFRFQVEYMWRHLHVMIISSVMKISGSVVVWLQLLNVIWKFPLFFMSQYCALCVAFSVNLENFFTDLLHCPLLLQLVRNIGICFWSEKCIQELLEGQFHLSIIVSNSRRPLFSHF